MTLAEKRDAMIAELKKMTDDQDRLMFLIGRGRQHRSLPETDKVEDNRVEGCLSNLWFIPDYREGNCYFRCDSDSAIVRGISGLLCEFYSGFPPHEILQVNPEFLGQVGITQHLTPNRRNALSRLWEKIRNFCEEMESRRDS